MKKSGVILIGLTIFMAQACREEPKEEWISGEKNSRDTVMHGKPLSQLSWFVLSDNIKQDFSRHL